MLNQNGLDTDEDGLKFSLQDQEDGSRKAAFGEWVNFAEEQPVEEEPLVEVTEPAPDTNTIAGLETVTRDRVNLVA